MTPPNTRDTWIDCCDCGGTGEITRAVRWKGEFYGEWVSHLCESCGGDGGEFTDPVCTYCEGPVRDDGFCPACNESGVADEPFTELKRNGTTGEWM